MKNQNILFLKVTNNNIKKNNHIITNNNKKKSNHIINNKPSNMLNQKNYQISIHTFQYTTIMLLNKINNCCQKEYFSAPVCWRGKKHYETVHFRLSRTISTPALGTVGLNTDAVSLSFGAPLWLASMRALGLVMHSGFTKMIQVTTRESIPSGGKLVVDSDLWNWKIPWERND